MKNIRRSMIKSLERSLDKIEFFNIADHPTDNLTVEEKNDLVYIEIQKNMLEELKEGYRIMEDINLELSELGIEEDIKDFKKYEKSIMGSGEQ